MIDFHCHIDLYPDPVSIADQCAADGMYVLAVTTAPSAWPKSRELLERKGRVQVSLGLHPQLVHQRSREVDIFEAEIVRAKYIGEIGLDGGPEYKTHRSIQTSVFKRLLSIAQNAGGRVMSLHSRHAAGAVLDMIETFPKAGSPILHWFTGSANDLQRAIRLDCWYSVGPAMLSSKKGRSLAIAMPRNRVLTETDGPFATMGGEVLFPWHAQRAVETLSDLWKVPLVEAEAQLAQNLRALARSA